MKFVKKKKVEGKTIIVCLEPKFIFWKQKTAYIAGKEISPGCFEWFQAFDFLPVVGEIRNILLDSFNARFGYDE